MTLRRHLRAWVTLAGLAMAAGPASAQVAPPARFDHPAHARLFPACVTCHEGAADAGRAVWPDPASCAGCHDGTIQPAVSWRPPISPRPTNLRFEHAAHTRAADSTPACTECHTDAGAPAMAVRVAATDRCVTCHGIRTAHLAAPDGACAICHLSLAQAAGLTRADVAQFSAPPSHRELGFGGAAHGGLAATGPASCATCHARDFCVQCHVDAPERPAIQALAPDPRSLAITSTLEAPASHRAPDFLLAHGAASRAAPADCATCHTRQSCLACHQAAPRLAALMPAAGPGRGAGAVIARREPASHGAGFRDRHGASAAALPASCNGCHARDQCLECHRPAAGAARGYHPAGFLERHPPAAYNRETSCSDCHSTTAFCASCHRQAGFGVRLPIGSGYHDAKQFFIVGHGVAARLSLETCVSCHTERDCISCHSALGGRRFNPHGSSFDPQRMLRKNPEVCLACHGTNIPGAP